MLLIAVAQSWREPTPLMGQRHSSADVLEQSQKIEDSVVSFGQHAVVAAARLQRLAVGGGYQLRQP